MKATDIKTGVVYAHQSDKNADVIPVVFLAPANHEHLYEAQRYSAHAVRKAFLHSDRGRPGKSTSGRQVGYAAVTPQGFTYATPAIRTAVDEVLKAVTLEDFENATSNLDKRGLTFMLVATSAHILGTYEEVIARKKAEFEAEEAARVARSTARTEHNQRISALIEGLAAHGITAERDYRSYGWDGVQLNADQIELLLAKLATHE